MATQKLAQNSAPKPILAIDTSCDDTAAAVTCRFEVWSNIIASQTELHKPYGGVFPTLAKQAHKENIAPTVVTALRRAGVTWQDISAMAVTIGPGLAPALEVGIAYAKEMAAKYKLPLIPVNHLEGHLLSVLASPKARKTAVQLQKKSKKLQPAFPTLGVLISGGHSEFILVKDFGTYTPLGATIDDAAGEALDKVGRMIDLGYPAGPVIEQFAKKGNPRAHDFPVPMTTSRDYNLSFSGLKTFSRNLVASLEEQGKLDSQQEIYDFAASLQYAIFRHINHKLIKILADHPEVKQVWLGGGVAANVALRKSLRETIKKSNLDAPLLTPYTKLLCQDNAAMIGVAAACVLNNTHIQDIAEQTAVERTPNLRLATDV
jgi:N6-L-threonylcarbamoyladenine synthase